MRSPTPGATRYFNPLGAKQKTAGESLPQPPPRPFRRADSENVYLPGASFSSPSAPSVAASRFATSASNSSWLR